MTFLYPLGLIGLVGIPIFIVMYLIKNRYTEQTIASTYMWRLSERFLKRRNPLSRLTGIISLILQLLLVAVLSLAVAHPIINVPGAAGEYCFIVDASASMNMSENGKSRFDLAKDEIRDVIDDAKEGSVFSLIYVGDVTEVVCELSDDRGRVLEKLDRLECSQGTVDYTDAIVAAQGYFNDNASVHTYLFTDTDYAESENIEIVNVARGENNISLEDVFYTRVDDTTVVVSGTVISYGADRMVDVAVSDGVSGTDLGTLKLQAIKDTPTPLSFTLDLSDFYSLTVKIATEDSMALDNVATVYSIESENSYDALLVSDSPFFIKAALNAVSNANLTVMSTEDYKTEADRLAKQDKTVSGYGLYIFDSVNPGTMPKDGSVWLIGLTSNLENSGFSVQRENSIDGGSDTITLTKSTTSIVRKLTAGLIGDSIYISKYVKCGLYGDFTTLFTYMGNPVIFTGLNTYGNREVVFAFNFHDSDFALSIDYLTLMNNLLEYSFPEIIDTAEYYCGDTAEINVISGCNSIRVETPSGKVVYTDVSTAVSEFDLTEVGEYKITVDISGSERELYVYSSVPKEERSAVAESAYIGILGEAENNGRDAKYDPMTLLFVLAALLFTAEWMVYCYDKYQLR